MDDSAGENNVNIRKVMLCMYLTCIGNSAMGFNNTSENSNMMQNWDY